MWLAFLVLIVNGQVFSWEAPKEFYLKQTCAEYILPLKEQTINKIILYDMSKNKEFAVQAFCLQDKTHVDH